jgi:farnesyl-diphosphate farnesyltransferase
MTNVSNAGPVGIAQSQNRPRVDDPRRLTRVGNDAGNEAGGQAGSEFIFQSTRERRMADIDRLLIRTSRTFALAIPLLPEPLRREVGVAYLLFRIADTFEDAACWPQADRLQALADFERLLTAPAPGEAARLAAAWVAARPCEHAGYLELLAETPAVLAELDGFAPSRRAAIVRHTLRTSAGMAGFVARGTADGSLHLSTLADLRHYCYIVAGIVGELLTELFLDHAPELDRGRGALVGNSIPFGEGLQLVNILKDADSDAKDGRVYLPKGLDRGEILAIARDDLRAATDYVLALQAFGAPRGVVSFTALPVLLARATLDRVERFGAGSSISRADVAALMGRLTQDLDAGAPALS